MRKKMEGTKKSGKGLSRRDFIKTVGVGSLALSGFHWGRGRLGRRQARSMFGDAPANFRAWTPISSMT